MITRELFHKLFRKLFLVFNMVIKVQIGSIDWKQKKKHFYSSMVLNRFKRGKEDLNSFHSRVAWLTLQCCSSSCSLSTKKKEKGIDFVSGGREKKRRGRKKEKKITSLGRKEGRKEGRKGLRWECVCIEYSEERRRKEGERWRRDDEKIMLMRISGANVERFVFSNEGRRNRKRAECREGNEGEPLWVRNFIHWEREVWTIIDGFLRETRRQTFEEDKEKESFLFVQSSFIGIIDISFIFNSFSLIPSPHSLLP